MRKKKENKRPKPVVLVILDGFGIAPPHQGNAISLAHTPNLDHLIATYPVKVLQAAGEYVGLRWGEMGSSQVGHLNIGAGRIFYQPLLRLSRAISDKTFFENEELIKAIRLAKEHKKKLHLLGLLSNAGVHSYNEHLYALLKLCKKEKYNNVFLHLILDGRDSPFNSGVKYLLDLDKILKKLKIGTIATLSGRFYAMDRDNHWDRIEKMYRAMVFSQTEKSYHNALEAIESYYEKKIFDEMIPPTIIVDNDNHHCGKVENGDSIIFWNFRPDRTRELTKAFVLPGFAKFYRPYFPQLWMTTLTSYDPYLPVKVAFPDQELQNSFSEIISKEGLSQLHVGETEKYAHVTYFFNGGKEKEFLNETRILIPSLGVIAYNERPEMSALEITRVVEKEIDKKKYDFIVINFANADMVGHTGDLKATIKAVEILDDMIGRIVKKVLFYDGLICITADHGNAEEVINIQMNTINKEHSTAPVPFILVGNAYEGKNAGVGESIGTDLSLLPIHGLLSDIAPTLLHCMHLSIPPEMTGNILIE